MDISKQLLDKAKEAFVMAIEVYNKPTIHYRLEGFSFFICNAWELMLKAHLIRTRGESSIYYPDKPNRTISLENCVQRIFTNAKAPLRMNLERIIDLRNTSTHFVIEEYEMLYVPLLQACVLNFIQKMKDFHNVDMTEIIPENFITLSTRITKLDDEAIRAKYPSQIAERLINLQKSINPMIAENNSDFAIRIEHKYYLTKKREEATEFYHIEKDATEGIRTIGIPKDPNETHKYTTKKAIREINRRLQKAGITLSYNSADAEMNTYWFGLFVKFYGIKDNPDYCYVHRHYQNPQYTYSMKAIDFIVEEIKKEPERILGDLKKKSPKP